MHIIELGGYTKSEYSYDLWKTPALFIIHEIFIMIFFLPEAISIILSFDVGIGKPDALIWPQPFSAQIVCQGAVLHCGACVCTSVVKLVWKIINGSVVQLDLPMGSSYVVF